jgi:hypothetical protein
MIQSRSLTRPSAAAGSSSLLERPPHSVEAEKGVLGSMLQLYGQSEAISECAQKINAEYFYVRASGNFHHDF